MAETNWVKELRKRGFKLTPLPPPTPEQMKRILKANESVKKFLKMMDEAYKASAKSTLRFATTITHHSGHHSLRNKNHQKTKG